MGKAYCVESSKNAVLKKSYVIESSKYVKLSKAYVVENGKYAKLWSASVPMFLSVGETYYRYKSVDGASWEKMPEPYDAYIRSTASGGGYYYLLKCTYESSAYVFRIFRSEDCVTWTETCNFKDTSGSYGNAFLRYLNGKLFIVGGYQASANNIWYSSDNGVTFTGTRYSVSSTGVSSGAIPLDFRYGTVNGSKGYYMILAASSATHVVKWASETSFTSSGTIIHSTTYKADYGALILNNDTLLFVLHSSTGYVYFHTYKTANTQVQSISGDLGAVCSAPSLALVHVGQSMYKFTTSGVTSVTGPAGKAYKRGFSSHHGAYGDGTFVMITGKASGNSSVYGIIYTRDNGATWTVVTTLTDGSALGSTMDCICYGDDYAGYYYK